MIHFLLLLATKKGFAVSESAKSLPRYKTSGMSSRFYRIFLFLKSDFFTVVDLNQHTVVKNQVDGTVLNCFCQFQNLSKLLGGNRFPLSLGLHVALYHYCTSKFITEFKFGYKKSQGEVRSRTAYGQLEVHLETSHGTVGASKRPAIATVWEQSIRPQRKLLRSSAKNTFFIPVRPPFFTHQSDWFSGIILQLSSLVNDFFHSFLKEFPGFFIIQDKGLSLMICSNHFETGPCYLV